MGLIWGRQDPGGPHVGPMDFAYLGAATCKQNLWKGTPMSYVVNLSTKDRFYWVLLTWINFNPRMDKQQHPLSVGEITYPFINLNGAAVCIWEWISIFHLEYMGSLRNALHPLFVLIWHQCLYIYATRVEWLGKGLTCHTCSISDMLQNLKIYQRDLNFLRYPTHHDTLKKRVTEAWISNCISQTTVWETCFWNQSPYILLDLSCFDMLFCTC